METVIQYYAFNKTSRDYARFLLEVYSYDPDIAINDALLMTGNRFSNRANLTVFFQIEKEIATFLRLKYGAWFVKDPFGDEYAKKMSVDNMLSMSYTKSIELEKYIKMDIIKLRNTKEFSYDLDMMQNKIKDIE